MRTYLHTALMLVIVGVALALAWAMQHDLDAPGNAEIVSRWSSCPAGAYLRGDGSCMITEFVPDLPARMWPPAVFTGTTTGLIRAPAATQLISYSGAEVLSVNTPSRVNCLYWEGDRVAFIVLANGRRVRVPCRP